MKNDASLTKETKAKAQRLAILLNEFLEKNIKSEDLSAPNKIGQYWKLLERNLWQRKMDPSGAYCLLGSDHSDASMDIPGLQTAEKVGAGNIILWLHELLRSVRARFEEPEEIYDDKDDDDQAKNRLIDYAQIMRTKLRDPLNSEYEIIFEADLIEFMSYLERCKDTLCGKWFVRRPNKIFCCHNCAARYLKRMKGKGDLQRSYRARRPNKKKHDNL